MTPQSGSNPAPDTLPLLCPKAARKCWRSRALEWRSISALAAVESFLTEVNSNSSRRPNRSSTPPPNCPLNRSTQRHPSNIRLPLTGRGDS